jgi:predicted type IV restriction endonuclease
MTKDQARSNIATLVNQFQADKNRSSYNESDTRHYYILPLFRALGWDTQNPAEFTSEEQISRKFVDFGFYLKGIPVWLKSRRCA